MDNRNLYKRGSTWYVKFADGNGVTQRKSLCTQHKAEARTRADKIIKAAWESRLIKPEEPAQKKEPSVTIDDVWQHALRVHAKWRDAKSQITIIVNYEYVTKFFPATSDILTVTPERVLKFSERLRNDGKSPSTINTRLSLLSVLLFYAEKMTEGRVKQFKMPRQTVRQGRVRILSREEEERVNTWLLEATLPDMAALVTFLVDTGFRLGEAIRLQSREVDWEHGMVPAWENKADHPRQVPMTKRVRALLEQRRDLERPFEVLSVDYAEKLWQQMRAGIGIDYKKDPEFVLHALRHTCASRLAAAGQDAFRIQKWMGHKNISTTQKYVTLFASDLVGLAGVLDDFGVSQSAKNCAVSLGSFPDSDTVPVTSLSIGYNDLQQQNMVYGNFITHRSAVRFCPSPPLTLKGDTDCPLENEQ